ncbi:GNAT family N-acetyltransferase [Cohnella cholangitidis]|uniref:GNAT family N-acetyltransferase n=1 Tax=Cohnella cholangitidis TaxID=2598458 RepID=A0A7G5C3J5_9BACL|nr:GNAT family N-acetyltransferase [Cohnella cholangitidis]QMV43779.1 GNAT family N-acetyltransferase [Cohnella cholangitidis]
MTIRVASAKDAEPLAKLVLLAIQDIAYQLTGQSNEAGVLEQLEKFIAAAGNRFSADCFLVEVNEYKPAGMILCYHGRDAQRLYQPVIDHLKQVTGDPDVQIDQEADEDEYYIDAVAVDPAFQGRGVAKMLISAAERRAMDRGYDKIALNVDQANDIAHSLYRKLGYAADKEITIHHKPYWHMTKALTE